MIIALTGTPGVGKTTVSKVLEKRGYDVLDLNEFIREKELLEDEDIKRDTFEVDIEELERTYKSEDLDVDIIEGHLSHYLSISPTVVLRCEPSELEKRMESKGWSREKIEENLEAEMMDAILVRAMENSDTVLEIDTTESDPSQVASSIEDIIEGEREAYEPGSVDWSDQLLLRQ